LNDATTLDEAQAATRLKEQTSLALIEIPANFTADVKAGKNVAITYRSNEDITAPSYILQAVQAAVQRMNGAVVASRVGASVADGFKVSFKDDADRAAFAQSIYDRAAQLWSQNPIKVSYITSDKPTESSTTTSSPSGFGQSVPGMGAMFVMFTVFAGMQVLIVERKNWTLQRLVTMPITRAQLLGGKILARFATGIIQFLVVLAVGMIMRVNLGSDLLAFALLIVMYTLSITAFSFALAPRLRTEQQAGSLSLLLSMVLAPLGGAWFPLDLMPQWMRVVGHVSPVAWAMEGFNNLVFNGGSLSTVLVQLAALVIFTVVFFIIGIRSFEYE
jgi:ABC-2 type transport system permease protein